MCVIDTYLVYASCTQIAESQNDFYSGLAEELKDNTLDYVSTRGSGRALQATNELIDASPHLTPSRKNRTKDGTPADGKDAGKAPFGCAACARRMIQMAPILGFVTTVLAKTLDNASNCIVWKHTEALMMNRIDVFMFILLVFLAS
jgi:hypothetical protein